MFFLRSGLCLLLSFQINAVVVTALRNSSSKRRLQTQEVPWNYTDVQYGDDDPEMQVMNIALPSPDKGPYGVVMFHHSKGRTYETGVKMGEVKAALDSGYAFVSWESVGAAEGVPIDPDVVWPRADACFQYLQSNAGLYGWNATNMIIAGRSMGSIVSWKLMHSQDPAIVGIYTYNALPVATWSRPDLWFPPDDVKAPAPPTYMVYGPGPDSDDGHNPTNAYPVRDKYTELGEEDKLTWIEGMWDDPNLYDRTWINEYATFHYLPDLVAQISNNEDDDDDDDEALDDDDEALDDDDEALDDDDESLDDDDEALDDDDEALDDDDEALDDDDEALDDDDEALDDDDEALDDDDEVTGDDDEVLDDDDEVLDDDDEDDGNVHPYEPFTQGANGLYIGHSFFVPMARKFDFFASKVPQLFPQHAFDTEFSGGETGTPGNLWKDEDHRRSINASLSTGTIDVFGMTGYTPNDEETGEEADLHTVYTNFLETGIYPPAEPYIPEYTQWIDLALSYNPNTAIYIGIPWVSSNHLYTAENFTNYVEFSCGFFYNEFVLTLRNLYPDTQILYSCYGPVASMMRQMFEDGELSDEIKNLVGWTKNSVFTDAGRGHAGDMMKELISIVWLKVLYDPPSWVFQRYLQEVTTWNKDNVQTILSAVFASNEDYNIKEGGGATSSGATFWA